MQEYQRRLPCAPRRSTRSRANGPPRRIDRRHRAEDIIARDALRRLFRCSSRRSRCGPGNWIVARAVRDEIAPGLITVGRLVIVMLILAPFALPGSARSCARSRRATGGARRARPVRRRAAHRDAVPRAALHHRDQRHALLLDLAGRHHVLVMAACSASACAEAMDRRGRLVRRRAGDRRAASRALAACRSTRATSWRSPR